MNNLNRSRNMAARPRAGCFLALFLIAGLPAMRVTQAADLAATNTPSVIPWNEIGAKAGAERSHGTAVVGRRQFGQLHRAMEREQLGSPRFGDEWRCVCAGGVGRHVVRGRRFHDGGQ